MPRELVVFANPEVFVDGYDDGEGFFQTAILNFIKGSGL